MSKDIVIYQIFTVATVVCGIIAALGCYKAGSEAHRDFSGSFVECYKLWYYHLFRRCIVVRQMEMEVLKVIMASAATATLATVFQIGYGLITLLCCRRKVHSRLWINIHKFVAVLLISSLTLAIYAEDTILEIVSGVDLLFSVFGSLLLFALVKDNKEAVLLVSDGADKF